MTDALALALELDRRVAAGGATETRAIPGGLVVLNRRLPRIRVLNQVVLDAPLPDDLGADELIALADRELAGLSHRFVRIDDAEAGERLAPALKAAGWQRGRTVFMTRPPDPVTLDPRARELTAGEHEAVMRANFAAADYGDDSFAGLTEQLVAAQRAVLAGTESRRFGAGEDGGLQSMCQLFMDPDVDGMRIAMVEEVGTVPSHRERGLAKAVVCAAVNAGVRWGAELISIPADADDWPQMIYAGLGFAPVGRQVHFTLRRPAS